MPRRNLTPKHTPYQPTTHSAACGPKQRFPNQLAATRAAELKNLEQPDLGLSVYRCTTCQGWHLTRRPHPAHM